MSPDARDGGGSSARGARVLAVDRGATSPSMSHPLRNLAVVSSTTAPTDSTDPSADDPRTATVAERLGGPLRAPGSRGGRTRGDDGAVGALGRATTVDASARDLVELTDCVRDAERKIARAVLLAASVVADGTCERIEGVDLELWLANVCRLIASDRKTLITASEVLASMPALAGLFADGQVSWGQVRAITAAVRRLDRDGRRCLDARIRRTCERWGGVDGYDPDELLSAVDVAVADLIDLAAREPREPREITSYFALQPRFDGTSRFWGEADRFDTPLLANARPRRGSRPPPHGIRQRRDRRR